MDQNYDQQQIQNLGQQPQQLQYQVQQQQQIPNQNFFQQQSQQIQNYGQGNIPYDNSLSAITNSPFQNMSSNNSIGNIVTTQTLSQPPQQQQQINNDRPNPSSNVNNNRYLSLNTPPLNCGNIHHGIKDNNGDDLLITFSRHMLMIKDHMVKIEQHYFELEQILNRLKRHNNN